MAHDGGSGDVLSIAREALASWTIGALFNFSRSAQRRWAANNPCEGVDLPAVASTAELIAAAFSRGSNLSESKLT